MSQIRVGGIGFGLSLKVFHIPFIDNDDDFKLHAILQRSPPKGDHDKEHVSIARPEVVWYRTEDEFFADKNIDLVVVGTPVETHAPLAKKALLAGKHVIVEKPFVPTSSEADELMALAREKGKVLTVFHNRRFDSDFLTLKKLIDDQRQPLGYIYDLQSNFDRYRPGPPKQSWKTSGPGTGTIYDLGSHLIDQALVLFGQPQTIQAVVTNQRQTNPDAVDDTFTILMSYDNQRRIVTLKATSLSCLNMQQRFNVRGTEGTFQKWGEDPQEPQIRQHGPTVLKVDSFAREDSKFHGLLTTSKRYEGGKGMSAGAQETATGLFEITMESERGFYAGFYKNVADAIHGRAEIYCKPEEARDVIKVIELAKKASSENAVIRWT